MKILFLSFYFPPDLSAGSFRSSSLVNALCSHLPDDLEIEVITTLPNRYSTFNEEAPAFETQNDVLICRIPVPQHKSGMIDQSKLYLAFARGTLQHIANKNYDLVYATSGRLMTAVLGAYIARKLRKPLYLDIRDIFVDTIRDVLPKLIVSPVLPFLFLVEKYAINTAGKVNLVSPGFLPYFEKRYPSQEFSFCTNGIDTEFLKSRPTPSTSNAPRPLTVLYAGNIGEGQGLEKIIPKLAAHYQGELTFTIVGDGGRKKQLEKELATLGCDNVTLSKPVKRDQLIKLYQDADILFLHLNDYPAFKKVLPSKLFEYAAVGKPIWAGVSGYAADFTAKNITNAAVFDPGDLDQAVKSFANLELVTMVRDEFSKKFARENIMRELAEDIVKLSLKS
ncbi:MAG: glycosyltransferase family 4 protein [Paracoccaceae bacterium]